MRLLSRNQDFVDVGKQLAGHGTLRRLKGKRGVIDGCDMIDGRRRFSVGGRSFLVDVPAILGFRPYTLREPAIGIERPGTNLFRPGIPSNDLHSRELDLIFDRDRERSYDEVLILRPLTIRHDFYIFVFIHPTADQPLQLF